MPAFSLSSGASWRQLGMAADCIEDRVGARIGSGGGGHHPFIAPLGPSAAALTAARTSLGQPNCGGPSRVSEPSRIRFRKEGEWKKEPGQTVQAHGFAHE
jgi:hypothetical protein